MTERDLKNFRRIRSALRRAMMSAILKGQILPKEQRPELAKRHCARVLAHALRLKWIAASKGLRDEDGTVKATCGRPVVPARP
jgi:hypothetical protein